MKTVGVVRGLFVVAALYDGLLGIIFLFASGAVFRYFAVTPPNHPGYVQFSACLLVVFALMFAAIARNPACYRHLIPYGMLMKISYSGVVAFHWLTHGIPDMWKPFCIFDVIFLILFAWAWTALGNAAGEKESL